jgi:hypothetical protein
MASLFFWAEDGRRLDPGRLHELRSHTKSEKALTRERQRRPGNYRFLR